MTKIPSKRENNKMDTVIDSIKENGKYLSHEIAAEGHVDPWIDTCIESGQEHAYNEDTVYRERESKTDIDF